MEQNELPKAIIDKLCEKNNADFDRMDAFYDGRRSGYEEAKFKFGLERMALIDKACKWLNEQLYTDDGGCLASEWYQELDKFIMAFRKAMEE